jgi:small subunit ribosomal protein S17
MVEKVKKILRQKEGVVISDKMDKTIVVRVDRRTRHPIYGKVMTQTKKYYAHDEKNEAKPGDKVRIVESRPLSRLKRWKLAEVLSKGEIIEKIENETEVSA